MNITDVRLIKVRRRSKLKAIVSVTFNDLFVVHDIKVIEGEKGLFIAMPSRKGSDGEFRDVAHPINSTLREKMQASVLEKYNAMYGEPNPFAEAMAEVAADIDR